MGLWARGFSTWAAVALAVAAWGQDTISSAQVRRMIINGRLIQIGPDGSPVNEDLPQNVFMPADRSVLKRLSEARQLLQEGRYGGAVRLLGAILDGSEDYFFQPDKKVPIHRSLKAEAQRLIGQMPPEGRQAYEFECGARARQRLTEAVSSGDADALAEVARRYFHTQAGYEATLLLGLDHLDRARPLAGALTLKRLRDAGPSADQFEPTLSLAIATCWVQAGMPEKAGEVLLALKTQHDGSPIEIAGKPISWFSDDAEAADWLAAIVGPQRPAGPKEADSWLMFRGNASRSAITNASGPLLNMRWRIPNTDVPWLEAKLRQDHQAYQERGIPVLPRLHPLAVGDVVLMRTLRNLLAVDFVTGRRLWEVPVDDPFDQLLGNSPTGSSAYNSTQLAAGLGYRMWDDATYGTMSSDGQYVFTIEDLPVVVNPSASPRTVIINGQRVTTPAPRPYNRLAAHNLRREGALEWHLGGEPQDRFPLRQAGTFFLGPPLPLMGRLYVLAEVKGEIRLLALEAKSGDLLWSQQLAIVERDILQDPFRRLAGVSPSYADGILVCPTSAGAVVAVDLATRSLLWGYRYGRYLNSSRGAQLIALRMGRYTNPDPQNRWYDAAAIVVDGRVLVTPIESDSLHCLNLIDGELLWKCQRNDDLFVACVHQDKVVLVGRRQVRAVCLSETVESTETVQRAERSGGGIRVVNDKVTVVRPKPAWDGRTVAFPEGSMPSGRGFSTGDKYFLPLASAAVMAIDLADGKAGHISKSRKGNVPGNLVCYKGRVISQGVGAVELFYQSDAARGEVDRRLAAQPEDPAALALQGELLLDEGKHAEGIASFRRAYELDADPRTRTLLRDALLEGLRSQFAAHRDRTKEIESLLDEPQQWATYLRLMATGLQDAGESEAALDHYLKLMDLDQDHRVMERMTKAYTVRLDRWVRAQLGALRDEAKGDVATIERAIEARLKAAIEADTAESLRHFLDYIGDHPTAGKARRELVRRLKDSGRYLEAELVLWREQESSDPAVAAVAVAELAEMLRQAKRPEDAAICYRRLGREFADVVCLEGKTGKEVVAALPKTGPVREALRSETQWPVGKVEWKKVTGSSARPTVYGRYVVPSRGSLAPFFSDTAVRVDQSRRLILGRDALGKQRWQVSMNQPGVRRSYPFNLSLTHARVCGHLLLVSVGYRVMAVNTLGPVGNRQPKLLWGHDMATDPNLALANLNQVAAIQIARGGLVVPAIGFGGISISGYSDARLNGLGPVTSQYVCFQRNRDLIATDPLTGEIVWMRHGTVPGSTLFGDDQFLFALPPQGTEATVFRALDGKRLGTREVPQFVLPQIRSDGTVQEVAAPSGRYCIAALGRRVLIWSNSGTGMISRLTRPSASLTLLDAWGGQPVWPPRKFAPGAKFSLVGQEAIGVWEPGGRFVLISLPDGRTITDVKLEREKSVSSITVFRSGDQYVLVAETSPPRANPTRLVQALPGTLNKPINSGRVYSFDLEGKLLWPEPAEIKEQRLLLQQPARLPVLTFACHVYDRSSRSTRRHQVSVTCLDKRTGRLINEWKFPYSSSTFEVTGDPKTKTVELRLPRERITMTFTDQPIPPPSEADTGTGGVPTSVSKMARGLLKAVGKAIGDDGKKPPRPVPQRVQPRQLRLIPRIENRRVPAPRPVPEPAPQPAPEQPVPR